MRTSRHFILITELLLFGYTTTGNNLMKEKIRQFLRNETLQVLMFGVFSYTCFTAVILATLEIPPEAVLDSGLQEIIMVFEG